MRRITLISGLLFVIISLVLAGCSSSYSPSLSAKEVISKSYDGMQAVNSFHFALDQVGGGTPITMGIEMTKASGDAVKPDKIQTTISATAMGTLIEVKMVTVGGTTMMTNPLSGKWEILSDQFKVLAVFDPGSGIAAITKGIANPIPLQDEKMGDTLCYHLEGSVLSETLGPITASTTKGAIINTEVWIGKEDFLVYQIKLTGKVTDTEKEGIIRTLTFSNFNQNINIALPQ
jgi:hypothetical protein